MANVIRLVNGGSIQVRTGVIQGVGPQGPRGVQGNQGIDGDQGPQGEPGPIGQILQLQGRTRVATSNVIALNTDTVVAFGICGLRRHERLLRLHLATSSSLRWATTCCRCG